MRHRLLTADEISSLAHGYGTAAALDELRAGQVTLRRLQLMAIAQRIDALPDPVRDRLDTTLGLFEQIARRDADVAVRLLRHPFLGTWAVSCLTRLESGGARDVPVDVEFGYLTGLAAAGAMRAGIEFELDLPTWDGMVLLPTLGAIDVGAQGDASIRGTATELRCTLGDRSVVVRAPFDNSRADWLPTRRVRLAPDLELSIEDTDPYGACFGRERAGRLSEPEFDRVANSLTAAWRLLVDRHPEYAAGIRGLLDAVVPLASPSTGSLSAASRVAAGSISTSIPDDPTELALLLVHEVQHMKLGELLDLVDLHDRDGEARHHAPWRADPRPVGALLQGVYAHLGVADFWRRQRMHAETPHQAEYEFAYWYAQTERATAILADSGELTEQGVAFVAGIAETLDSWRGEHIDPIVVNDVADLLMASTVDWRMRNHIAAADDIARLSDAWSAGAPACGIRPPELAAGSTSGTAKPPSVAALITALSSGAGDRIGTPAEQRTIVTARPSDPDAWIGLAIALRRTGHPAAAVVEARPEVIAALCRRLVSCGARAEPDDVASWLGGVVG